MSTNCNCEFIQVRPSEWYYVLEDFGAPRNAWDWREHARAYGPFPTQDRAIQHLDNNHPNPGGWTVLELPQGCTQLELAADDVLTRLIEEAPQNTRPNRSGNIQRMW